MEKTKTEDLVDFGPRKKTEEIKKVAGVAISIRKPGEQTNLFGDKDQLYNTLQEEISIVVAMIQANQEAISKKKDQVVGLQKRKDNLERAARTVAKMRDEELKKKKEEKLKR